MGAHEALPQAEAAGCSSNGGLGAPHIRDQRYTGEMRSGNGQERDGRLQRHRQDQSVQVGRGQGAGIQWQHLVDGPELHGRCKSPGIGVEAQDMGSQSRQVTGQ